MSVELHTRLCDALDCRHPVVQTAMGWIADARLVAATCNAGGFGFLAGATMDPGQADSVIEETKTLTDRPFGLNFHMLQPNIDEVLEAAIRHKVKAVSYGRGPDAATVAKLKDAGIICMPTVGAVKHAVKAVEFGADIVTIQGSEGGGHTGSVPTSLLLPQVLDAVDVPVVAAGGYSDGRGLAAALSYGAAGIAMGTRFLLTTDSPVPRSALQRYYETRDPAVIRITTAVDGLPQRFIENDEIRRLENLGALARFGESLRHSLAYRRDSGLSHLAALKMAWRLMTTEDATFAKTVMAANLPTLVQRGVVAGDPDHGLLPSGQVAAMIDEAMSCAELISGIIGDAHARLVELAELTSTGDHE